MINSSADDKRGIVKLGFTPRENDEYTLTYIKQDGEKDNPPYSGNSGQKSRYWQWPEYDKESFYYQGTTQLNDRFTLKSRLYRDTFENTLMMYNSLADLKNKKAATAIIPITATVPGYNWQPMCVKTICCRLPLTGKMTYTGKKVRRTPLTIAMKIVHGRSPVNINGLLPIMSMSWLESAMTGAIA